MNKQEKDNKKQRVKLMLLAGQKPSKKYLDRLLDVTNSAELVSQLRKEGMTIDTIWKVSESGKRYGEYVYIKPPKG